MEILDIDSALEYAGGEKEFFIELASSFIEDTPAQLEKLKALEKEDFLKAASYVHYYKGAARQLAAKKLSSTGQKLEDILRKKTDGNIEECNLAFIECHKETIKALKEAVKKLS